LSKRGLSLNRKTSFLWEKALEGPGVHAAGALERHLFLEANSSSELMDFFLDLEDGR
jgi:hypothetical protein